MSSRRFLDALQAGPLLLDAGMGTRLMAKGLDFERDDPSLWCLDHPDDVLEIHQADVQAGSDILFANSFGANRFWLDRFGRGHQTATINRAAVELARQAAGTERFVIGSIGPTAADGGASTYVKQANMLAEAGVDALILETHTAEKAIDALASVQKSTSLPVLVSLCSWPQEPLETARQLFGMGAIAVGTNCGSSPEDVVSFTEALSTLRTGPLLAKPSGFFPPNPDHDPVFYGELVAKLLKLGVRLMGGCCGTDERAIAAMRAALNEAAG